MPHINRIRVNNVKYNFKTQYYDDFIMRFSGKNTIYDLANGGGKSVLMLLLLQNMIPNCTLDEKQPIEKLFRSGNGNTTIHSLIEWKLNKDDIQNGYQYMTTGFCARKAKDSGNEENVYRENATIDYFNYVIFYREYNDNDIKNLPLSNGKERITYQGLKNYLKELEHKDYSLIVKIFERKGEYQQFIRRYGIYESEWEIIRGINKTEGHVRTYFETNYKTARKVVEDLLIEEIIQKSYYNNTGEGADFAKLLLDIKNKLVELTKKKKDISNYDRQVEVLNSFIKRLEAMRGMYHKKGAIEKDFIRTYNTCKHLLHETKLNLENLEKLEHQLEKERALSEGKVETALIQIEEEELAKLDQDVQKAKKVLDELEQELEQGKKEVKEKENQNDFLEYIEYKKQYETAILGVNASTSKDNNLKILEQLSSVFYEKMKELQEDTEEESVNQEIQQIGKEISSIQEEKEQLNEILSREKSKLELWEEENKSILNTLEERRTQTTILLYEEIKTREKVLQEQFDDLQENITKLKERKKQSESEFVEEKLRLGVLKEQETHILKEMKDAMEFQKNQEQLSDKIDKMKEFYEEREQSQLKERIYEQWQNNSIEINDLKREIKEKKKLNKVYQEGKPFAEITQIERALELINVGKMRAESGVTYLAKQSDETKQKLIDYYPMLPFGIVIHKDYESVLYDKNLKQLALDGTLIVIFNEEKLKLNTEKFLSNEIYDFITPETKDVIKEDYPALSLKENLKMIEEKEKRMVWLVERGQLIRKDISYLEEYENIYLKVMDVKKCYEENKLKLGDITREIEQIVSQQNEYRNNKEVAEAKEEYLHQKITQVENELGIIREIAKLYGKYEENQEKKRIAQDNLKQINQKLDNAEKKLKVKQQAYQINEKQRVALKLYKEKIQEQWKTKYKNYYREDTLVESQYKELDYDSLEVRFDACREAYLTNHADVADKQRLAENYQKQMERLKNSLMYRSANMEELQKKYEAQVLGQTSLENLKEEQKILEGIRKQVQQKKSELAESEKLANIKFGSIAHGKTFIEEKYGTYQPLEYKGEELRHFIVQSEKREKEQLEQIKDVSIQQKNAQKSVAVLENISEDMVYMMETAGIDYTQDSETLQNEDSLREKYKEVKSLYDNIMKEEYDRRENFEKEKHRLKETLILTNGHELALQIEKHIECPTSESQSEEIIENIKGTISCIQLEKSGVEKGISDMEIMKRNFESQCLQSCVNMKSALDRLSKLSGIQLDGKQVPMITLSIPYIKEDFYQQAMSDYIDKVIETADTFSSESERVRYIRNQLAWKRLFSVIVKDMNLIKLNLYKRERMKEQSRYLPYEEAVGSTGQSQGIYIQFLIAMIHYITSMNSANADSLRLKNVIFIDNPFGAAKDVYIWEPIFKLLKANNVQLIVPARGATPAITGRFEVNYILGQKLIDGKQQTVVIDYRSQTETDELEYTSLTFEQETLFD